MTHWTETLFRESPELFAAEFESRVERAPDEVDAVLDLVAAAYGLEPERVLDVPCGVGRHAVPFADRGLTLRGVDLSPAFLKRARERAADAGVTDRTTFTEGDMREVGALSGRFDLAVNLWTSIGYYDEDADRRFLRGVRDRLAPGGAVVLELANKEGTLANFQPAGVSVDDDRILFEDREYDPATSRVRSTRWIVDEDDGSLRGRYETDLRAYAPVELGAALEGAGFADVRLYASLEGESLTRESIRLVALGRVPDDDE